MFAQLLITAVTVWVLAEVLCRLILGHSVVAAARELFTPIAEEPAAEVTAPEPNAALRRLLTERRQKLADTGARLELTMEAAEISEQLALREAELAVTEGRLTEIQKHGSARG